MMAEIVAQTISRGIAVGAHPRMAVLGMAGTAYEMVYPEMSAAFGAQLSVDLRYRAEGSMFIQRHPVHMSPQPSADRVRSAPVGQGVEAVDGNHLDVRFDSTCTRSYIPGAPQMASAARRVSNWVLPSSSKEQYQ